MTEREPTTDEILDLLREGSAIMVDQAIASAPDTETRQLMLRNRARLIDKTADLAKIRHLKDRNVELEQRLRPRLVEG